MDLDQDWEFVPDDGFLEIHDDGGNKILSRKYGIGRATSSPKNVFNMDYFTYPSSSSPEVESPKFVDSTKLIPLPVSVQLDHPDPNPITPLVIPQVAVEAAPSGAEEAELDPVFKIFFKKMKENEFVDMKMESPKSGSRGVLPQLEAGSFQFEEKSDDGEEDMEVGKNSAAKSMEEKEEEGMNNLWKGVGAICSFGMAAATICIIIFGNGQRNKHNQKLRFQIYSSNDKRIKRVVEQATKLNEAISSAVRGVPLNRAHITTGGYYDGL